MCGIEGCLREKEWERRVGKRLGWLCSSVMGFARAGLELPMYGGHDATVRANTVGFVCPGNVLRETEERDGFPRWAGVWSEVRAGCLKVPTGKG